MCSYFGMFSVVSVFIIVITIFVFVTVIMTVIRNFSKNAFGNPNLVQVIRQEDLNETEPKSLSGMDAVYLPQIMEDFPSFNPALAKSAAKEKLRQVLSGKKELSIHNVVIAGYIREKYEKTVCYQASLQYRESGRLVQKRYRLHYTYMLPTGEGATISANCPNCGGVITSPSQTVCEYCDSMLVNVMGSSWEFTEVGED